MLVMIHYYCSVVKLSLHPSAFPSVDPEYLDSGPKGTLRRDRNQLLNRRPSSSSRQSVTKFQYSQGTTE